jgi:hypothetical protein
VENNTPVAPGSTPNPATPVSDTNTSGAVSTPNPFTPGSSNSPTSTVLTEGTPSTPTSLPPLPPLPNESITQPFVAPNLNGPLVPPQSEPSIPVTSESPLESEMGNLPTQVDATSTPVVPASDLNPVAANVNEFQSLVNPGPVINPPDIPANPITDTNAPSQSGLTDTTKTQAVDFTDAPETVLIQSAIEHPELPPQFKTIEKKSPEANSEDDSDELPPPVTLIEPKQPTTVATEKPNYSVTSTASTSVTQPAVAVAPAAEKNKYAILIAFLALVLVILLSFVGYLVYQLVNLPVEDSDAALNEFIQDTSTLDADTDE